MPFVGLRCVIVAFPDHTHLLFPHAGSESSSVSKQVLLLCFNDIKRQIKRQIHRGSYMSAYVLLNLLNELGKRDKMRGLPSILSLFRNEFNKFNNTRARMLHSIYHMTFRLF